MRLSCKAMTRAAAMAVCLGSASLGLTACAMFEAPQQLRGNRIDPEDLKALTPGTSTRADVTALVGSPTTRAAFDDNTWIYISETTANRIGRTPGVLDQNVVVMTFNEQGVLSTVESKTKDDSLPVQVVTRTTPSPGTEASFLQQLLGNIGRFNALGSAPPGGGAPRGGAPAPY
jgi:outer membrane protein assembly factor BamE (lipoprotein component of BamABCDE complex)